MKSILISARAAWLQLPLLSDQGLEGRPPALLAGPDPVFQAAGQGPAVPEGEGELPEGAARQPAVGPRAPRLAPAHHRPLHPLPEEPPRLQREAGAGADLRLCLGGDRVTGERLREPAP